MIQVTVPTVPNPGATEDEWQAFDAACRVADIRIRILSLLQADETRATREAHAHAQAETAAAMQASVEAQKGFTAAMREPDPLPPLAEQARIVSEVERHLSIIREVEAEVDINLQRAQALRQSTLAHIFSPPGLKT